jgi:hypothetical protein
MKLSKARFAGVIAALTLVLVQTASAVDTQPVRFNPADQAAAKAATLRMSDLGTTGWRGGAIKPTLTPDKDCPTKKSDLVVTGAAKSEFKAEVTILTSEAFVLQSAWMVNADWRRTVGNAAYMACGRRSLMGGPDPKVTSFTKVAFPDLADHAARYRAVLSTTTATGSHPVVVIDFIFLAEGRTEILFSITAPYINRTIVDGAGRRLAKILVSEAAR